MLRLLPTGLIGVLITALGAAYMSTLDTHLNWGSSYLVNDTYRRFIRKDASDAHYVLVSRALTVVLIICAAWVSFFFEDAGTAFNIILSIGAGTGLIYILRWFWHRINAWTEISAMIAAPATYAVLHFVYPRFQDPLPFHVSFPIIVAVTTAVWLTATLLTAPTDPEKLDAFYRRIRPAGPGWNAVRRRVGNLSSEDSLTWNLVGMLLGIAMILSALFGIGNLAYLRPFLGVPFCLLSLFSLYLLLRYRRKFFYL